MPAVTELCAYEGQAVFARVRNARLITSNEVLEELIWKESYPYCIWYPKLVATEKIYQELPSEELTRHAVPSGSRLRSC